MVEGKKLVIDTIKRKKTERIPWVPFVGSHAGYLIDKTADEFLKSSDLIIEGQLKAVDLYQPDGIPVTFDLQIEAEALGCDLNWGNKNPPAVSSHILQTKELEDLSIPQMDQGRIDTVMTAARQLRQELPDIALYGLITGPFTLAMHLLGSEMFIKMYDDAEWTHRLLEFCKRVGQYMAAGYLKAGCDVIAVVDPMTTQIGPEHFEEFISQECTDLFKYIREEGGLSSFFVCGHALKNLEVMCDCDPDYVSVDENIPLDVVRDICLERDIAFGGNMRLTTALLNGSPEENKVHAYECMQTGGDTGFILSPGCDLPYQVPVENLQAVTGVVRDEYEQQVAAKLLQERETDEDESLDLSDYGTGEKVVVDVITIDSESCAPCQYMVEAVKEVVPLFEDLVIWREHKIKSEESVAFMKSLMVKNIPTIVIDGEISFVSMIPPRDQLIKAIQDKINEKLKIKIRNKQGKIIVIGEEDDDSLIETRERVKTAIKELGLDIQVEASHDKNLARSYGAGTLPAVIAATSQLKSAGRVPEIKIVKEWLKDLV